jgi:hypothetical protein
VQVIGLDRTGRRVRWRIAGCCTRWLAVGEGHCGCGSRGSRTGACRDGQPGQHGTRGRRRVPRSARSSQPRWAAVLLDLSTGRISSERGRAVDVGEGNGRGVLHAVDADRMVQVCDLATRSEVGSSVRVRPFTDLDGPGRRGGDCCQPSSKTRSSGSWLIRTVLVLVICTTVLNPVNLASERISRRSPPCLRKASKPCRLVLPLLSTM